MKRCWIVAFLAIFALSSCKKDKKLELKEKKSELNTSAKLNGSDHKTHNQNELKPKEIKKQILLELIKKSVFDAHGLTKKMNTTVKDYSGNDVYLFTYKGIVFRTDDRSHLEIKSKNGFKSKNDLKIINNMKEAQGISNTVGASGENGLSTAKIMGGAIVYGIGYSNKFLYVINTSKLNTGDSAYDFDEIITKNYPRHSGAKAAEVNVTEIPYNAILGWFPRDFCDKNEILTLSDERINKHILDHFNGSKEAFVNDMIDHSGFVFNEDYAFD